MPELAEVETLMRYLKDNILNQRIVSLTKTRNNLRYTLNPQLKELVEDSIIINITRRAKFLNISLSNGNSLIIHLGMSGRLTVQTATYKPVKHDHLLISLADKNQLIFNDTRRFGMVYICKSEELDQQSFLKNMGIEPLTDQFTSEYLIQKLQNKKNTIKAAIMDNKIVVGIGNIYASESLFEAKINPQIIAKNIKQKQLVQLVKAIKRVLHKAIRAGGTTLRDFVNGNNQPGYFQQKLNVYDREGKNCYYCLTPIKKIKQAGRSSFFCPECQG